MVSEKKGMEPRERGFTLLELILALMIMGLGLAVSYPALSRGSASLDLRASGRDLLNLLRYAREKAITEGAGARVVLERSSGSVMLTDAYGDGERRLTLRSGVRIAYLGAEGEEVVEGPLVVRFLPNGSTERAEVILESKSGSLLAVVTDPITGGARVLTEAERQAERRAR